MVEADHPKWLLISKIRRNPVFEIAKIAHGLQKHVHHLNLFVNWEFMGFYHCQRIAFLQIIIESGPGLSQKFETDFFQNLPIYLRLWGFLQILCFVGDVNEEKYMQKGDESLFFGVYTVINQQKRH